MSASGPSDTEEFIETIEGYYESVGVYRIATRQFAFWEKAHQSIRVIEAGGERAAAVLVAKLGDEAEVSREPCDRLYTLRERKERASEEPAFDT